MARQTIQLQKPVPAAHDCLPHAAMNLGQPGAGSLRPNPGLVSRLILEEQFGNWVLYRLDADGGFIGDTWHGSREDAVWQIQKEFGIRVQ